MPEFLRSIIVNEYTPLADGTLTYDLPVNPVSHLILGILALNTAAAEASAVELAQMITNVQVMHRGTTILQMRGEDLYAWNHILLRKSPILLNQVAAISSVRALMLIIPFGRKLYNPDECFPESKAGELQIQLTVDIAVTNADGLILQLESVELLGARPSRYLKQSTLVTTPNVAGPWDVELPLGNVYSGIMLRATTKPATTLWPCSIEDIKLLADNREHYFSSSNWECLRGSLINRPGMEAGHTLAAGDDHIPNYAYMDFNPSGDDKFLMPTAGMSALTLRIEATSTDEIRLFPMEMVTV